MRLRHLSSAAALLAVLCVPAQAQARDIGRDTLPANDGWAAYGTGTTGGAAADDAHVYTVTNRAELVRALDGGSATPKIIKIAGSIDADTDDDGDRLDCADYATDGYGLKKYLAAYDPRTWGSARPSGPQEEARQASAAKQAERIVLPVGSNTTIVGLGGHAVQRAPRVRFGQVHVYDNRYLVPEGSEYRYSLGVSTESAIYAENNAFTTPSHVEVADLVKSWNGSALHQSGTLFNGYPVDLLAIHNAYNSGSERDLTADVGWTPTLHGPIDSAAVADREVARGAGAGRIP
ncbi:hypothetical protein [Streptomyces sp. NPDC093984]|uniref:pectate lyase family protein n=1 Tax=Streptomyces sp. NPDC093984 TaxID=3366052 RepID=UPI00382B82C1